MIQNSKSLPAAGRPNKLQFQMTKMILFENFLNISWAAEFRHSREDGNPEQIKSKQ